MRVLTCCLLSVLILGAAEPTGIVSGRVLDATTRSPLAGASVVAAGTRLGTACDSDGWFVIKDVPAGTYAVEASMIGFKPQAKTSVVVTPGRATDLVFRLEQTWIRIKGVEVRTDYFPKVKDAPVSERTFSAEEIEISPGGVGDIQRVVQAMPAVVSSGDQDNEIIVRGGNPTENLFLLDGIEIPFPNHFGDFFRQGGPISMFNPLTIREVDFIAGALPARYGGRISSVMDIALKRGSLTSFSGNIDMGMSGIGAVAEFPLPGKGNSFLGSYHKSFLELLTLIGAGGWGEAVPYYDNALGKAAFRLDGSNELSLVGVWGLDHIDIEPDEGENDNTLFVSQKTDRYAAGLGLQTLFADIGFGKLLLSGTSVHWDQFVWEGGARQDTLLLSNTREGAWTGKYDVSLRLADGHETRAGVVYTWTLFEFLHQAGPDTVYRYTYGPDSTVLDSTPLIGPDGRPYVAFIDRLAESSSWRTGGYVQHRLALGAFARLTFGCRLDHLNYTGQTDVSPRVGLSTVPLLAGISAHAGYGWHHQDPQWYMLLQDSLPNRDLRSRRSDHYVVGVERVFGRDVRLSFEAYLKQNSRLPFPAQWLTPDSYDYSNAFVDSGTGTARGAELFLQKKHSHNWHATLAYSLSRADYRDPQQPGRILPADYDYRHVLTATCTWDVEFSKMDWYQRMPDWLRYTAGAILLSDQATFGARFRYMGGRPYTPMQWVPETRRWVENSLLHNSARYPDYIRLDLRWDHRFMFRNWSLTLYAEIENVLDRKNIWEYSYIDGNPEREVIHQFDFFPLGGLVIEF